MSFPAQDPACVQPDASEWMHRGIDLMNGDRPEDLAKAIACFDEAIALRQALPLAENPRHRYGLAAGWMNRADALSRLGTDDARAASLCNYDQALTLLRTLPLDEDPLYARRLAIAWINRAVVGLRLGTPGCVEAAACLRDALAVLESAAAASIADRHLLRAGALINLGDALLAGGDVAVEEACIHAERALVLVAASERKDAAAGEAGLKARHALCRASAACLDGDDVLSTAARKRALDAVDGGLALAREWEQQGVAAFRALAGNLFRFGCRLRQSGKPSVLVAFILDNVDPERARGVLPLDDDLYSCARVALWSALAELQRDGFEPLATPRMERVLEDLRHLRTAEKRLEELRRALPA